MISAGNTEAYISNFNGKRLTFKGVDEIKPEDTHYVQLTRMLKGQIGKLCSYRTNTCWHMWAWKNKLQWMHSDEEAAEAMGGADWSKVFMNVKLVLLRVKNEFDNDGERVLSTEPPLFALTMEDCEATPRGTTQFGKYHLNGAEYDDESIRQYYREETDDGMNENLLRLFEKKGYYLPPSYFFNAKKMGDCMDLIFFINERYAYKDVEYDGLEFCVQYILCTDIYNQKMYYIPERVCRGSWDVIENSLRSLAQADQGWMQYSHEEWFQRFDLSEHFTWVEHLIMGYENSEFTCRFRPHAKYVKEWTENDMKIHLHNDLELENFC